MSKMVQCHLARYGTSCHKEAMLGHAIVLENRSGQTFFLPATLPVPTFTMSSPGGKLALAEEQSYRSDEESAVQRDWSPEEERRAKRK